MGIAITFIILAALLSWIIIGIGGKWLLKGCLTTVSILFGVLLYVSIPNILGWPSSQSLSEKYQVLWIVIKEPSAGDSGSIYLWTKSATQNLSSYSLYNPDIKQPRVFAVPYSRELHEQAQGAIKALKAGKVVMGGVKGEGEGKEGNGKDGKKGAKKKGHLGESWQGHNQAFLYELPESKFPPKPQQ